MTDSRLFDRAKTVGLAHVKEWLVDGRQEGDEWTALNPTRADKSVGSFRVNLQTGAWSDFATDDRGGDAVSLYAYLNRQACENAATARGYRNHDGGVQAEAARAILEAHDNEYFPSSSDDFAPPVKSPETSGGKWDGYRLVEKGMVDPPELDTAWFAKQWGEEKERWDLIGKKGAVVMRVVRFNEPGAKKNDRPFTLWTDGTKTRWRCKALTGKYPLWGAPELVERENDPVLLCEGQKAACRAAAFLKRYVSVGWYGGVQSIGKSDFSPLQGRRVFFWPDADRSGRNVIEIIKRISCEVGFDLKIVFAPAGVKHGWDVADAITDGMTEAKIEALIERDSVPADKSVTFVDDIALRFPNATGALDDIQDAYRMAHWLQGNFLWCEIHNCWYVYDCGVWQKDNEELKIMAEAKQAIISFERDAIVSGNKNGIMHYRAISKNINRVKRILDSMKSDCHILVSMMNHADNLVNCKNGTYNLDTGELQPFAREDYHTKQIMADFKPDEAVPEKFLQFINDIFLGNEELIRYVQKILGYALGGGTGEQEFYILFGDGNNGKSQLIKCFSLLADSYAHNLGADKIMQNKYANNETYIAQLKKIRALFCSESKNSSTLDSDLIKTLTGGEPVTVAQKYEKPETFEISAKVFLVTNNKPQIRDTTEGIWRRIRLIPFDYVVPHGKRVKDFGKLLYKSGPSGILNWLIEGYQLYRIDGLEPPDIVKAGDADYRSEEDIVLQFLTEMCLREPEGKLLLEEIFQAFKTFTSDLSLHWSKKKLSKELKSKKLGVTRNSKGMTICGIVWKERRPGELDLTTEKEDTLKKSGLV